LRGLRRAMVKVRTLKRGSENGLPSQDPAEYRPHRPHHQ
jgi:hypothetical protein